MNKIEPRVLSPRQVSRMAERTHQKLQEKGTPEQVCNLASLLIEEIAGNEILHGNHRQNPRLLEIQWKQNQGSTRIRILIHGRSFDSAAEQIRRAQAKPATRTTVGGNGLRMIYKLIGKISWSYEKATKRNIITADIQHPSQDSQES